MTTEKQNPISSVENQQIRYDLVNTAVNFLLNPTVIDKPYEHKAAFLRKKGLTDAEIALAYEKAESNPNYKQILENSKISSNPPVLPPPVPVYRPISFWSKLSGFSSSLIVLGVAVFGAHYVYKKFVEPLLFGEDKKKKSVEKQLFDMARSLSAIEIQVTGLQEVVNSQKMQLHKYFQNEVSDQYPTPLALRELKTEVASLKSLLLNRHQFPALPKVKTIPHWQLPSEENKNDVTKQNDSETKHEYSNDNEHSILKSLAGFESIESYLSDSDTEKQNAETEEVKPPESNEELGHESS